MSEQEKQVAEQLNVMAKVVQLILDDDRNQICSAYRLTLMGMIAKAEKALKELENQTQ